MNKDFFWFCILEIRSYLFCVDFIFNFGKFEVIFFFYKYLLLKLIRINEVFVFIGLIVLYYSKLKIVYKKIVFVVFVSCLELLRKVCGYVIDGEKVLLDVLVEIMLKVIGLRCFNYFRENCRFKLKFVGIIKK